MRGAVNPAFGPSHSSFQQCQGKDFSGSSKREVGNYIFLRGFHENDPLLVQVQQRSPASIQQVAKHTTTNQTSWTFGRPCGDDKNSRHRGRGLTPHPGSRGQDSNAGARGAACSLMLRTGLVQMCVAVSLPRPQQEGVCNYSHMEKLLWKRRKKFQTLKRPPWLGRKILKERQGLQKLI